MALNSSSESLILPQLASIHFCCCSSVANIFFQYHWLQLCFQLTKEIFTLSKTSKVKMPSMPFKDTGNEKSTVGFTVI